MNIPDICIAFTVSILGVAYPLLLNVISRLDEKYSSVLLLELFKTEKAWYISKIALIATLSGILAYIILALPPFAHIPNVYRYVHLSVLILSLVILIIFLFLFVQKILIYFTPGQLLKYLMRLKDDDEYKYFRTIADLLYFAIRQEDRTISQTVSDYFYLTFLLKREAHQSGPLIYPSAFYEAEFRIVRQLAALKNREFTFLDYRAAGGLWMLGELEDIEISEDTYRQLWENMLTAVEFKRDDFISHFWGIAHQHFVYHLNYVSEQIDYDQADFPVLNVDEVNQREKERKRFLEFAYALGGLLIYEKRYAVFKKLFTHTTSIPPSYDLLPISIAQIFAAFIEFTDTFQHGFSSPVQRYYYHDASGISGENIVRYNTAQYFGLLFLRQWFIIQNMVYIQPFAEPQIPAEQRLKRVWLDHIPFFRTSVKEVYNNSKLLLKSGFSPLTDEWCREQNKPLPIEWIDRFEQSIKDSFADAEEQQAVADAKTQQFYDSSAEILETAIEKYTKLFTNTIIRNYDHWVISGIKTVTEKSPFAENQGVDHLNFHTFLAGAKADNLRQAISETFSFKTTQRYLLKGTDIFAAIDKVKAKPETHIIINFGISLQHYIQIAQVEGLEEGNYKSIPIYTFNIFNRDIVQPGVYLIRSQDLPYLAFSDVSDEEINKYNLRLLSERFRIYGAVIDLNIRNDLASEVSLEDKENIQKLVLLYLTMRIEIRWKKKVKLVGITQYSEYRNNGLPNSLKDVRRF